MVTKKQGMVESVCPSQEGMNPRGITTRSITRCLPFVGRDESRHEVLMNKSIESALRRKGWFIFILIDYAHGACCPSQEGIARGQPDRLCAFVSLPLF